MKFLYFLMVQFIFQNLCTEMYFFLGHLAHWSCGWGIPKKRTRKMQLRNIDLRSVRHSNKKLSPRIDFWDFHHVYPLEHLNPISPPPQESSIKLKNKNYGSIINIKRNPKKPPEVGTEPQENGTFLGQPCRNTQIKLVMKCQERPNIFQR